ncbi:MAG: extracellular solute-binding protein [Actinobacteria bacterium]|nr:extracellular solute-binding protein [Actinomycetota bacterium]MBO0834407.1 extracellular solute-binding protein [Actinomycetota bacterium]
MQLHVLDYFTGGVDNAWMKAVVAAFEKKYPNVTISRQSMGWGDVMQALPLKMKGNNPPDIVPANNGWQSLGTLVQGGLVLNLDDYAKAYGWRSKVPASILAEHEFSTNGKQMGTGSLFGMPVARASMIEVYYNRALLQRLALSVPKTFDEFVADLGKAKSAGMTPIALGNVEQTEAALPLFSAMNAFGEQQTISNLIYSRGTADISSASSGFPQAVRAVQDWANKGYFTHDFAGVSGTDAAQAFVDGKALFHFDFSGSLPLKPGQSKNFGSFILPRNDGKPPVATMSSATNLSISAKDDKAHAAAAAAFLNFAASPTAARLAVNLGTDPMLAPSVQSSTGDPLFADDVSNAATVAQHDSSVPYLDWTTPTMLTTITTKLQDLFAGKTSVSAVISAAKADDDKFKSSLAK